MISVIIPTYNHARSLPACLASVLASTHVELEVIIVNDGSTDGTHEWLESQVVDPRVTVIHQENQGSNPARNRGAAAATGEYLFFFDADGALTPMTLAFLKGTLVKHPEAAYAYCDFRFGWKSFLTGPFDAERLKKMNYIHTSALIRREAFPGFDESIRRFQDWDLWLTLLEQGKEGVYVKGEWMTFGVERKGISSWMPKAWYRRPWRWLPQIRTRVEAYETAKRIIAKKHGL